MSIRDNLISGPLGFGSAPLGNMFRNIPEAEAAATVDAAWQQGIRYFDTAPLYGAAALHCHRLPHRRHHLRHGQPICRVSPSAFRTR